MKIAKALKVKNRLTGELNKIREIWKRENSRRSDNISHVDVEQLEKEHSDLFVKLVEIKSAISVASYGISYKLVKLAELKSHINFINSLHAREGDEVSFVGRDQEKLVYTWKSHYNQQKKDEMVSAIQEQINMLQDEIDDYNSKTDILSVNF
jgi:hypothetical protein